MREIKFRALKDDMSNCRFYYGNLIYNKEGEPRIQDVDLGLFHTCIKGTESQYTGLMDRNWVEIYEGDIIKTKYSNIALIKWSQTNMAWIQEVYSSILGDDFYFLKTFNKGIEVIGNIYENPELLKKV